MKKTIISLCLGSFLFVSCKKEALPEETINLVQPQPVAMPLPCINQSENPTGRSYDMDSLLFFNCKEKHCGLMPMSAGNYWIYEDSIFNDGVFQQVKMDTLRYSSNLRSLSDGLIWWESKLFVGIPQLLYNNDTAMYGLQTKLYNPEYKDVKRDFFLFPGDSVKYLSGFDDIAASGRSLRMKSSISVPAGEFDNYLYFEKNARNYRKDQVYFKPGVGVLKYIQEKAPFGQRVLKLQQVMTLVAWHVE